MSGTRSELPPKRLRQRLILDGPGSVPVRTKPVKGDGRHAKRDYCERCGHTKARCICQ